MTLELKEGRTYRGKRPKPVRCGSVQLVNDRTIIWLGVLDVQYDGPAVATGRHYPRTTRERFLAWADKDITDQLPDGEYEEMK